VSWSGRFVVYATVVVEVDFVSLHFVRQVERAFTNVSEAAHSSTTGVQTHRSDPDKFGPIGMFARC
jgi:hypothetical protein